MKFRPLIFASVILTGCAHFQSHPISPAQTAAQLKSRRLDDPGLKKFLEQNLGHELKIWPLEKWDLPTLTLAAFYFQPGLEVARAQWRVALAGIKTAGGRPNPIVSLVPGYDTSAAAGINPWIPLVSFDLPLETAGKRGKRIAAAQKISESARFDFFSVAWKVRGEVRDYLIALKISERRAQLLQTQLDLQKQIVTRWQQRVDAGEISPPEMTFAQIALSQSQINLADARAKSVDARAQLAQAIGVPATALDGAELDFDFSAAQADLTSVRARQFALQTRADILGALADYAAAEADLRLEIAKQFPDVHLNPGYQFDQGDNKWSLGLTVELPLLNQNQGPIAEAEARRKLAAAKFIQLQAQVIGEIDRAIADWRVAREQFQAGDELFSAQQEQKNSVEAQAKAGAADSLDLLNAQLEANNASLVQLESSAQLQQSFGALADALQFSIPPLVATIEKISANDPRGEITK
jgi:cobalt-zinc-cadmium efflux system outer membrane protein